MTVLGALAFMSGAALAAPKASPDAARFVQGFTEEAIATAADDRLTTAERERALNQLLLENFDLDAIARLVLGRHWRRASDAERVDFRQLLEEFVVAVYARRFDGYAGEQVAIGNVRPVGRRHLGVASQIVSTDGPPVSVDWVLAEQDGQFQVVDVHVEGISMVVTQRSEFSALLERNGGRMAALFEALRAGIADGRVQAPPLVGTRG